MNGDRGNVIWPLISIGIGCYVFLPHLKIRFEKWIALALPILVFFIWVVDVFRNSDAFSQASALDLESRVEALMNVGSEIKDREVRHNLEGKGQTFFASVGSRLWGGYDHLIFTMTPGVFPHAWFENFSAMPSVWIPFSLSGNREGAAAFGDAYIIASTYRGSFSPSVPVMVFLLLLICIADFLGLVFRLPLCVLGFFMVATGELYLGL